MEISAPLTYISTRFTCLRIAPKAIAMLSILHAFWRCGPIKNAATKATADVGEVGTEYGLFIAGAEMSAQGADHDPKTKLPGLEGLDTIPPAPAVKGPSGRIYMGKSLYLFLPADAPRCWAIRFVEFKAFETVVMIAIICNCTLMGLQSPLDSCCTLKAAVIDVRDSYLFRVHTPCNYTRPRITWCAAFDFAKVNELIYLAISITEMIFKVLAYGFCYNKYSYMNDPWCRLDMAVLTITGLPGGVVTGACCACCARLRRAT